ncbi:MAG: hypothetical protein NT039_04600 [Candidatus Berkelbacteria bacterium]|nr:hypothetical protein [Candidatus Berkelbacteria bacterium]
MNCIIFGYNKLVPEAGFGASGQVCWQGCSSAASIPGSHTRHGRDIRTRPNKLTFITRKYA